MINQKLKYLIGVDEVGRGPLAGPVCLCLTLIKITDKNKIYKKLAGIKDSKKLSEKQRIIWKDRIRILEKRDLIKSVLVFGSVKSIDKMGIAKVIFNCIEKGLKKFKLDPAVVKILLDGRLKAPIRYLDQKTIIKGDEKEKIISVSSILAKIKRDDLMIKLSKKYSEYNFEKHKGYGTKKHFLMIRKHGLTPEHRLTFLKSI